MSRRWEDRLLILAMVLSTLGLVGVIAMFLWR